MTPVRKVQVCLALNAVLLALIVGLICGLATDNPYFRCGPNDDFVHANTWKLTSNDVRNARKLRKYLMEEFEFTDDDRFLITFQEEEQEFDGGYHESSEMGFRSYRMRVLQAYVCKLQGGTCQSRSRIKLRDSLLNGFELAND